MAGPPANRSENLRAVLMYLPNGRPLSPTLPGPEAAIRRDALCNIGGYASFMGRRPLQHPHRLAPGKSGILVPQRAHQHGERHGNDGWN
jgi:hypothetical protein